MFVGVSWFINRVQHSQMFFLLLGYDDFLAGSSIIRHVMMFGWIWSVMDVYKLGKAKYNLFLFWNWIVGSAMNDNEIEEEPTV